MRWFLLLALAGLEFAADVSTVRGVVVDESGTPIAGVCLDHFGAVYCNATTGDGGTFEVRTRAPAMVFRKAGFEPKRVRPGQSHDVRVVMSRADERWPVCGGRCDYGLDGLFCFAGIKGMTATRPVSDVDYQARVYGVRIGRARGEIRHGRGTTYTLGLPRDRDVWESPEYSERDYVTASGVRVVDARGKSADGGIWRFLGTVGESASYNDVKDPAVASMLDRILDGVCFVARE